LIQQANPGKTIAQIFTGLLTRQFGEESFTVERVVEPPSSETDPNPAPGGSR
jgi:hypothetical protein